MRFFWSYALAVVFTGLMLISFNTQAFCFNEAGARYHVSPSLLRAIAEVESGMNPEATGYNRDRQGR
ncbi:transglycosylase SLT domain-containing protein, partial [Pseudomonas azotoformans]